MYFLEDDVIGLRSLEVNDISKGYGNWLNDSAVCEYNSHHRFPVDFQEAEDYIILSRNHKDLLVFAVELKTKEIHIGNISLQHIDLIDRQAEIAFLFGNKEHWGHGYATRAAAILIEHAFMELGMNRIYFGTSEKNIGMQKVGEKLNFIRGGIRRQALYKHGRFLDIYDYDLLKEEWLLAYHF